MATPLEKLHAARLGNLVGTTGKIPERTGLKQSTPEKEEELLRIARKAKDAAEVRKIGTLGGTRRRKMRKQTRRRKHRRN
jgi:hypothetical protein